MLTLLTVVFSCRGTELLPESVTCSHRQKPCAMKRQAFFQDVIAFKKNSLLPIEYGAVTLAPKCRQ